MTRNHQNLPKLIELIDSQFNGSSDYTQLSDLISSLDHNQAHYSPDQCAKAQLLTNNLVHKISQFLLNKCDSDVFRLINQSISMLPAEPNTDPRIDDKVDDDNSIDETAEKTDNNNDQVINRIAKRLHAKVPTTEDNLVKFVSQKLNLAQKLKSSVADIVGVSQQATNDDILAALKERIENDEFGSSDDKLRLEFSQISQKLNATQKQMNSLQNAEQEKDLTILELQNKIAELQNTEMMNDLNSEMVDHKIDIERYKSEIVTLKNENAKLLKFKTKAQKKIVKMQQVLKQCQQKNESLVGKVDDLQNELDEIKDNEELELPAPAAEENQNDLQIPFDQLVEQYEKQCQEMHEESDIRMQLLDSIQKLLAVNSIYDQKLQQLTSRVTELENIRNNMLQENSAIKRQMKEQSANQQSQNDEDQDEDSENQSQEIVDDSLIDGVKQTIESINGPLKNTLSGIAENPSLTISKRVLSVISALASSIHQAETYDENPDALSNRNKLLLGTVGSLMHFFNDMIESEEIRSWAFTKYSVEESKNIMASQVQAIQQFMDENCIKYLEDENTVLSAFVEKNDPLALEQTVKRIISSYETVSTNEGKDLLILLHQSLAAGLLLQAYATQVTKQWSAQDEEKKELQQKIDDLELMNEKCANKLKDEIEKTQREIDSYKEAIEEHKAKLEMSYSNAGKDDQNVATSNLTTENSIEKDRDGQKQSKKLKKKQMKLDEMKKTVKNIKSLLRSEVQNGNLNESILVSLKNLDQVDPINDEEYVRNLEEKLQQFEHKENEEEQVDNDNNNEAAETDAKYVEEITDLQQKLDEGKQANDSLIQENNTLRDEVKELHHKLKRMHNVYKKSHHQMKSECKEMKNEFSNQLESSNQRLENEIQNKDKLEQKCKELLHELNELKQANRQLQINYKLTSAQLLSRDEEIKREKSITDSQWKLKQYNLQANAQAKIEQYKEETEAKLTEFLLSVCQLFKKFVDINQPIDCDNVYGILKTVANKLDEYTKKACEFERVCEAMNSETGDNMPQKVRQLAKENSQLTSQVKTLTSENAELKKTVKSKDEALISRVSSKDWEDWALPLYQQATNSKATKPTPYIMRKGIENAVKQSLPNGQNGDKSQNSVNDQNVSVSQLTTVTMAALRLEKSINMFKSNQDIAKTKFTASGRK